MNYNFERTLDKNKNMTPAESAEMMCIQMLIAKAKLLTSLPFLKLIKNQENKTRVIYAMHIFTDILLKGADDKKAVGRLETLIKTPMPTLKRWYLDT